MDPRWFRFALVALLTLYAALYARTAEYELVWDDFPAVMDNPLYEGAWTAGIKASQHDHVDSSLRKIATAHLAHDSYRPVLYLSHRIERELYGKSEAGHHLHNVLVGGLALLMVLAVVRRWLMHDAKALAVAGVFALHPLQVESIAYVSGRGDLLAALFALASLWFALRGADRAARRWPWVIASTIALVLSMLSKEAYIGVPIVLLLIGWSMGRPRAHVVDICAHAVGLALYLVLRLSVAPAGAQAGLAAVAILPGLWLQYFSIFLSPVDLSIVRPHTGLWVIPGWLALLAMLGAFGLATRGELGTQKLLVRQAVAGALMALVLIGPSAVVVKIMNVVADRYVCLPLVGYAVAIISAGHALVELAPAASRPLRWIGATLSVAYLIVTALQITVWSNPRSLYQNAYMHEPHSSAAAYGLGLAHVRVGDWSIAMPLFMRAVELDPKNSRAWNNLAVGALEQGDYHAAVHAAERAAAVTNAPFRALYNLGVAHLKLGQVQQSCAALARSLEVNASYQKARELMDASCPRPAP
jgi:hypothetical protein